MSKKLTKKQLASLEIKVNEKGFSVWINETVIVAGKKRQINHWVLDASDIRKDGLIRFGELYKGQTNAVLNEAEQALELVRP